MNWFKTKKTRAIDLLSKKIKEIEEECEIDEAWYNHTIEVLTEYLGPNSMMLLGIDKREYTAIINRKYNPSRYYTTCQTLKRYIEKSIDLIQNKGLYKPKSSKTFNDNIINSGKIITVLILLVAVASLFYNYGKDVCNNSKYEQEQGYLINRFEELESKLKKDTVIIIDTVYHSEADMEIKAKK